MEAEVDPGIRVLWIAELIPRKFLPFLIFGERSNIVPVFVINVILFYLALFDKSATSSPIVLYMYMC